MTVTQGGRLCGYVAVTEGEGVGSAVTVGYRGGGGVEKAQFCGYVVCEQPLTYLLYVKIAKNAPS